MPSCQAPRFAGNNLAKRKAFVIMRDQPGDLLRLQTSGDRQCSLTYELGTEIRMESPSSLSVLLPSYRPAEFCLCEPRVFAAQESKPLPLEPSVRSAKDQEPRQE